MITSSCVLESITWAYFQCVARSSRVSWSISLLLALCFSAKMPQSHVTASPNSFGSGAEWSTSTFLHGYHHVLHRWHVGYVGCSGRCVNQSGYIINNRMRNFRAFPLWFTPKITIWRTLWSMSIIFSRSYFFTLDVLVAVEEVCGLVWVWVWWQAKSQFSDACLLCLHWRMTCRTWHLYTSNTARRSSRVKISFTPRVLCVKKKLVQNNQE